MGWIWLCHRLRRLAGSSRGDGIPGRVAWGVARLIFSSSLVRVNTSISLWQSVSVDLLHHQHVESMTWIRWVLSLGWITGPGGSDRVPGRVAGLVTGLILGGCLVGVGASIGKRSSCELDVFSMAGIRVSHGLGGLTSSRSGNGVPCRITWSITRFVLGGGFVSIGAGVSFWKRVSSRVLLDCRCRGSTQEKGDNSRV